MKHVRFETRYVAAIFTICLSGGGVAKSLDNGRPVWVVSLFAIGFVVGLLLALRAYRSWRQLKGLA